MSFKISSLLTPTNVYLTTDTPNNYPPLGYLPSNATIEPYPSLPSITTTTPLMVGPNTILPQYTVIQPSFPLSPALDLDNDEASKQKIAQYFLYKLMDKWLYGSMNSLLGYFKVSGNNVTVLANPSENTNDSPDVMEKKIKFIENNIFSQGDMYFLLKDFAKNTNTKWANLIKEWSGYIKSKIKKELKHKIIRFAQSNR